MTKKLSLIICLHLFWINAFTLSSRIRTPYFKALKSTDLIIKGEVIGYIPIDSSYTHVAKLKIAVLNNFNNNFDDTIWIKQCPSNSNYPKDYYKNLQGQYYIILHKNKGGFYYYPIHYEFLKIKDGYVTTNFNGFDVFLKWYLRIYFDRKMRIERFERKVVRKMERIKINKIEPSKSCEDYLM